jgi:hypothetical protein
MLKIRWMFRSEPNMFSANRDNSVVPDFAAMASSLFQTNYFNDNIILRTLQ